VYLALGRSTILKFLEEPERVVVGNNNYYNVEYINNDVTLQPLGAVDTNLFVYTKSKRTYALILKIVTPGQYDDIVHVRWKSPYSLKRLQRSRLKKKKGIEFKPISINLNNELRVEIIKLNKTTRTKSYLLQFKITNNTGKEIQTDDIDLFLSRAGKKLKNQKHFIKDEKINVKKKTQARLFFSLSESMAFSVNVTFKGKSKRKIIARKFL
jgi:hypothetical protein